VLRGSGRTFIAGVAVSGLVVVAALNVAAPDAIVARYNIERAARTTRSTERPLDLQHMSDLSAEAAALTTRATLTAPMAPEGTLLRLAEDKQRCYAAHTLLQSWGPTSEAAQRRTLDAAWRFWNAGETGAIRYVSARSAELRNVHHEACAGVPRKDRLP
jgi:hypothetical protein